MNKNSHVIGIDLGGTKLAAGLVSSSGKILLEKKEPTDLLGGWPALKKQIVRVCRELQEESGIKARAVGIGSAGPLHAPSGKLLDPTNFGWTNVLTVKVASELQAALRLPTNLENDAAAAVLAERWKGGGKKNCVVITLGTGVGVGAICNGALVRGGRELHPEAGHILLRPGDPTAPCGCGNYGCAEAFLSGKNFEARASKLLHEPGLQGKNLVDRAARGEKKVLALFDEYATLLADFLNNLVVLYYPEQVIFTGSFAAAQEWFLPQASERLGHLLERRLKTLPLFPKLEISKLGNRAGILGGAFIAFHPKSYAGAPR